MADLGLSTTQLHNAEIVVAVGKADGFSNQDIAIALMTALTESGLQNYANQNNPDSLKLPHDAVGSDHGSVGIFQQQVGGAPNSTANWGTTAELMDPATASQKFYDAMRAKYPHGTGHDSPWMVAQNIQGSAYSDGSNYQANWAKAQAAEAALFATSNSIPHIGIGGPWPVGSLKPPLPDATRNKLIVWLIQHSPAWQGDADRKKQTAHLQQTADIDLITQYNDLAKGYSVQGGDPGTAVPGAGPLPSVAGWMKQLENMLKWLTNVKNWERVGLFALGAILLMFAFNKLFNGAPAGLVTKAVMA